MISYPVTIKEIGKYLSIFSLSFGQSKKDNGAKPDENQVSSTSSSLFQSFPGDSIWTLISCPLYHAGIWWPHQSCLDIGRYY